MNSAVQLKKRKSRPGPFNRRNADSISTYLNFKLEHSLI